MSDPAIVQDGASQIGLGGFTPEMAGEEVTLKAQKERMKQAQSQATKRGEAEIMSQYGPILSKPYEEFKPTQETMSGFAALGSLLMVAGGMMGTGGKMAGIGAMNNIAGMLKGYQTGRQDLYEKERQQYESNMKAFEKNHALMKEAFDRALKMAPYNLTKAQNQLRTELTALGAKIPAAAVDKHGLIQTANDHSVYSANLDNQLRSLSGIDKRLTEIEAAKAVGQATSATEKDARQKRLDESLIAQREVAKNLQEYTWTENGQKKTEPLSVEEALAKRDQEGVADFQKAPTGRASAQNQRFAFNVREAFAQTAKDLQNVTLMPKDTVLGAFSGLTGQAGSGLVDSLRNVFAREVTPEDQRQFQILISGFENNLSRALGGGYANSGSARAVDAYKTQVAREGDSPSAKALFLARAKQELNILSEAYDTYPGVTPEDTNFIKKYTDVINQAVPFDVADVVIASPRSSAKLGSKKVATEEDILATMSGQNLNRNETIKKLKAAGFTIEGE